jgi:hypothetical protein
MLDKSAKPQPLPATNSALQPGDFPLGSVESRAAARVAVQRIQGQDSPQKGDVLLQLEATGWPDRHRKIMEILYRRRDGHMPKRNPGIPIFWLALPEGRSFESIGVVSASGEQEAEPKGSERVAPLAMTDLPYIWEELSPAEQAKQLGKTEGGSR